MDVVDQIETILAYSIDTDNCMALVQLADQLNLNTLLERSLSHMMQSMQSIEDMDKESHLLTPELAQRIQLMKAALESSIHNNTNSRLYFSSLDEYISLFAAVGRVGAGNAIVAGHPVQN